MKAIKSSICLKQKKNTNEILNKIIHEDELGKIATDIQTITSKYLNYQNNNVLHAMIVNDIEKYFNSNELQYKVYTHDVLIDKESIRVIFKFTPISNIYNIYIELK